MTRNLLLLLPELTHRILSRSRSIENKYLSILRYDKMKNIIFLILALSIYIQLTYAQKYKSASTGPIPKIKLERVLKQNHSAGSTNWDIAYGYSSIQSYILSLPIPAGTPFTLLSSWIPSNFASSMVNEPWTDYYYITEIGPPSALYKMNSETGVVTLLGNITGLVGSDQPNGISYNSADGDYYIISSTNLYSFDPITLNATMIGPINTGGLMIDLCFDWSGVCYAYDVLTDNAYTINLSTGNATFLGPLGYDANYGQGMSYDHSTGTIYLSAFNNSTFTGQLRTMDPVTGMTTLITDWGFEQLAPFSLPGIPCLSSIPPPHDPDPPSGASNLPINGVTLSWINGMYTIDVEVWFGPFSNVEMLYDGPAITSWELDTLLYSTNYRWFIIDKDTTCMATQGPSWFFSTVDAPGVVFIEPYNDLSCWTWIGPFGQNNWSNPETNFAGGNSPELKCYWTPTYVGLNQLLSCTIYSTAGHNHELSFKYMYEWFADPAPVHGLAITYDGGNTSTSLWEQTPLGGNSGPEQITLPFVPTADSLQIIIYNNGDSFNFNNNYYDDVVVTDLEIIPVELISFYAEVNKNVVTLFWQTITETNNRGFEIGRSQISNDKSQLEWNKIGFVSGFGTTTEIKHYSFIDDVDNPGKYQYRLKQIDYDGTFHYSYEIEAEVVAPLVFSLEQNYPNPFNPITNIIWHSPIGSWQTLKVYDVLGNEIVTLVDEYKPAGRYEVEFSSHSSLSRIKDLPSGVYFYQLKSGEFIQAKKMILIK